MVCSSGCNSDINTDPVQTPRAAVAFTGGKDSVLALHIVSAEFRRICKADSQAKQLVDSFQALNPVVLVSFRPLDQKDDFKAHSQEWTSKIAESLGIPLVVKGVGNVPSYEECYRSAISELARDYQVTKLVTGDIEDIGEGFMDRAVTRTGVDLVRPLWKLPRVQILDMLSQLNIDYVVTLTRLDKLPIPVSEKIVGHVITKDYLIEQFNWYDENFPTMDLKTTVDLAGEYGEMHSMVTDSPLYKFKVIFQGADKKVYDTKYGSYLYLVPRQIFSIPK
ncbi:hypothetical protein FB645_002836 [Coemansia sp. IMI 203386]|nr:hypothetical protein FB645_002836 [Coemansia sp. IMI 203386]